MLRKVLFSLMAVIVVACGGGGGSNGNGTQTPPSGLSYSSPAQATVGTPLNTLTPTVSGTPTSYSVSPALPAGLSLNSSSGAISGTPTAAAAQTTYTITATNGGGSTTFGLVLTVNNATATGVFVDSVVSGLSYTSGAQSGITGADGSFTYEVGQTVTFRVGGVVIGSTAGKGTVTPLDLVENSTGTTAAVQNIVRFLLLMDSDGDPANGITISAALRERAANWPSVDFTTSDLDAALASIVTDTSVDGTQRTLPSASIAQSHLLASFRCLFSGYFRGTYDGDDNGRFAFTVAPNGGMAGAAYSIPDDELIVLQFSAPLAAQNNGTFVAGLTGSGSSFSGQFTGYDQVSGNWTDGTFSGSRYAGTPTPSYKFLALFLPPSGLPPALGSAFIEVGTNNAVSVIGHVNFETHESGPALTATLTHDATQDVDDITVQGAAGATVMELTFDRDPVQLFGTWTDPNTGNNGQVLGIGCRLR